MSNTLLYIGVMSGSSLDGVDVALIEATSNNYKIVATHFQAYSNEIKDALLTLHFPSENELEQSVLMANQLASCYAQAVNALLDKNNLKPKQIAAIGCHGQTIRHQPTLNNDIGYTIQLGNNALLAELTNITVIGDFRTRDIAAGGQGAPLVPAFHQAAFASNDKTRAIVNIGGIANISYLGATGLEGQSQIIGFDSGPGNILLDHWVKLHLKKDYDANGAWAATGVVNQDLLASMLADPYFALPPPKSTGRDLFNQPWLEQHIKHQQYKPEDIARTLVQLTCDSLSDAIIQHCPDLDEVYLCGGGAHNTLLKETLQSSLDAELSTTDTLGIDADWVEAAAFAWLAKQTMEHKPSNLPSATGARGLRILGAIYPS